MADEPFISKTPNAKRRVVFMNAGKQSGAASSVPPADGSCEGFVLTCVGGVPTWVPPSGGGGSLTTTTNISNATLRTTDTTTIVAAPGAGFSILVDSVVVIMRYGGTNVWTNNPSINLLWGGGSGIIPAFPWTNAFTRLNESTNVSTSGNVSGFENQPFTFSLVSGLTGNAANDNTATVVVYYRLLTL